MAQAPPVPYNKREIKESLMDFDSEIFQMMIASFIDDEQYEVWLRHENLDLEDWLTNNDEGFDKYNFNHYHPGFLDFVMSQVDPDSL
jgi:hypothetical protein